MQRKALSSLFFLLPLRTGSARTPHPAIRLYSFGRCLTDTSRFKSFYQIDKVPAHFHFGVFGVPVLDMLGDYLVITEKGQVVLNTETDFFQLIVTKKRNGVE